MDKVFQLFEGECPTCGDTAKIVSAAGTTEFFKDHPFTDVPSVVWSDGVTERGEVNFRCPQGHSHFVFNTFHNDWVA